MSKPILLAALTVLLTSTATASGAMQTPELPTVMVVTKSDNRNELHYGVVVDDACAPKGNTPLQPYWLMVEKGPHRTEPLSNREASLLGITHQEVDGNHVRFVVNAMPERAFTAQLDHAANGTCTSSVDSIVAGVPARIVSVYAKLGFLSVDYVELTGRANDGRIVQERVHP